MATELAVIDDTPAEVGTALARPGHSLARREMVGGLIRPVARPEEMFQAQEETRALLSRVLQEGRDYGTIQGTKKPTMLQPGAERSAAAFGLAARFEIMEKEVDHDRPISYAKRTWEWHPEIRGKKVWSEEPGQSEGLYRYVLRCVLVHRESGVEVGEGVGSCSTMESKYIDRPRDLENTVLKMAKKRAHVDAVLTTLGLHDQFTQDVEDMPREVLQRDGAGAAEDAEREPECPVCGGAMWDNRQGKKNPKAPDFKCRDKACDGVFWPGQWPPAEESEVDRLATGVRKMVEEIRALDAEAGTAAESIAEGGLQREDVTAEEVRTLGGKLLARLKRLQKQAKKPVQAEEPEDPAELNAYLDKTIEENDPDTPEAIGAALADDDELPF